MKLSKYEWSPALERAMTKAAGIAEKKNENGGVYTEDVLAALILDSSSTAGRFLCEHGIKWEDLANRAADISKEDVEAGKERLAREPEYAGPPDLTLQDFYLKLQSREAPEQRH